MGEEFTIREGAPGDAADIARVHMDGWRTAYAGIMFDDSFEGQVSREAPGP